MSVKTQKLCFYRQEPCPFSKCECRSEYNKNCSENGLTPNLYVGFDSDYCEISSSANEGEPTIVRKYKQCSCPANYGACPTGTNTPDINNLAEGQYCVEVNTSGTQTTKYLPETYSCSATTPSEDEGWIDSGRTDPKAQSTYNNDGSIKYNGTRELNKTVLSYSNQSALERLFLQECGYQKNGIVKGDGCGRLYYKCRLNPSEYPYYNGNCEAPKVVTGGQTTGGWDGTFTMYQYCDCPDAWYSQEECTELSKKGISSGGRRCMISGAGGFNSTIACDQYHNGYNPAYGVPDPNTPALKIYGDSCIKEDGTEVRKYCECNMDVFYYYYTGASPYASCIDGGSDERINQKVYVCYFDNDTAKKCSLSELSKMHME